MSRLKLFNEYVNEGKEPIIEYKKENDKYYMCNPSGGDWIEISKKEYDNYKRTDKKGKFTEVNEGIFRKKDERSKEEIEFEKRDKQRQKDFEKGKVSGKKGKEDEEEEMELADWSDVKACKSKVISKASKHLTEGKDPMDDSRVMSNLSKGYAIEVNEEDYDKFFDLIDEYGDMYPGGINYYRIETKRKPSKLYFVLIGNELYHTSTPKFGGQDLKVYIATF